MRWRASEIQPAPARQGWWFRRRGALYKWGRRARRLQTRPSSQPLERVRPLPQGELFLAVAAYTPGPTCRALRVEGLVAARWFSAYPRTQFRATDRALCPWHLAERWHR